MSLWTAIQMDLFMMDGHSFLLVVDMTSCFPVVWILNTESYRSVRILSKEYIAILVYLREISQTRDPTLKQQILKNFMENLVL